jgi:hypothetical protein
MQRLLSGDLTLKSREKLEFLYGVYGADLMEAAPETKIAGVEHPVHVHFRGNKNVHDEHFQIAARLDQLEELVANETSVTDVGMLHLSNLPRLRVLHLGGTIITDSGLIHLQSLPLELLDISRTSVTDRGLSHLARMKHLKELWIIGCCCTEEGVAAFRAAAPSCRLIENEHDRIK